MKCLYYGRGKGKTTELIKLSAEKQYHIVCCTMDEANRIHGQSIMMLLKIPYPLIFCKFLNKEYRGKNIKGFLFDNIDMLLQSMTTIKIHTVTMTREENENNEADKNKS